MPFLLHHKVEVGAEFLIVLVGIGPVPVRLIEKVQRFLGVEVWKAQREKCVAPVPQLPSLVQLLP